MSRELPDLARTRAAISAYDALDARISVDEVCGRERDGAAKMLDDLEALGEAVGAAFGEDTKDRNDPETCRRCVRPGPAVPQPGAELSFVRRMVKAWEGE